MTYIEFFERLVTAESIEEEYKLLLKGKDLKKAGERIKQFIVKYCTYFRVVAIGEKKVIRPHHAFNFLDSGPLKNIDNLVKLYNFFFIPSNATILYSYRYEKEKINNELKGIAP